MSNPGDLGLRIAERRPELGLDRAEVAFRGVRIRGTWRTWRSSRPQRSSRWCVGWLLRLLGTTWEALAGVDFGEPVSASGTPAGTAELAVLGGETCYALIEPGGIRRLLFTDAQGSVALPVTFRLLGRDIVFRTGAGSIRAAVDSGGPVGFQVDRLDETLAEGWSVLGHRGGRRRRRPTGDRRAGDPALGRGTPPGAGVGVLDHRPATGMCDQ